MRSNIKLILKQKRFFLEQGKAMYERSELKVTGQATPIQTHSNNLLFIFSLQQKVKNDFLLWKSTIEHNYFIDCVIYL